METHIRQVKVQHLRPSAARKRAVLLGSVGGTPLLHRLTQPARAICGAPATCVAVGELIGPEWSPVVFETRAEAIRARTLFWGDAEGHATRSATHLGHVGLAAPLLGGQSLAALLISEAAGTSHPICLEVDPTWIPVVIARPLAGEATGGSTWPKSGWLQCLQLRQEFTTMGRRLPVCREDAVVCG